MTSKTKSVDFTNDATGLTEYPGVGNKSKEEVERDYDNLLGNDPWDYLDEFNRPTTTKRILATRQMTPMMVLAKT